MFYRNKYYETVMEHTGTIKRIITKSLVTHFLDIASSQFRLIRFHSIRYRVIESVLTPITGTFSITFIFVSQQTMLLQLT